jgi:hypothetical protein
MTKTSNEIKVVSKWDYNLTWNDQKVSIISDDIDNAITKLIFFNNAYNKLDDLWSQRFHFISKRRIF